MPESSVFESLVSQVERLSRERDEARAEVARLRAAIVALGAHYTARDNFDFWHTFEHLRRSIGDLPPFEDAK